MNAELTSNQTVPVAGARDRLSAPILFCSLAPLLQPRRRSVSPRSPCETTPTRDSPRTGESLTKARYLSGQYVVTHESSMRARTSELTACERLLRQVCKCAQLGQATRSLATRKSPLPSIERWWDHGATWRCTPYRVCASTRHLVVAARIHCMRTVRRTTR
jgi:hypothetical protein